LFFHVSNLPNQFLPPTVLQHHAALHRRHLPTPSRKGDGASALRRGREELEERKRVQLSDEAKLASDVGCRDAGVANHRLQ